MAHPDDQRMRRIRRNNRILLAVLVAFVLAIFVNSIFHIGEEARPDPAAVSVPSKP